MRPVGKYIVIKTIDEEVKTKSGLLLSATDVDEFRYKKGKVIEPGNEVTVIDKGDSIYYDKNSGFTLNFILNLNFFSKKSISSCILF